MNISSQRLNISSPKLPEVEYKLPEAPRRLQNRLLADSWSEISDFRGGDRPSAKSKVTEPTPPGRVGEGLLV